MSDDLLDHIGGDFIPVSRRTRTQPPSPEQRIRSTKSASPPPIQHGKGCLRSPSEISIPANSPNTPSHNALHATMSTRPHLSSFARREEVGNSPPRPLLNKQSSPSQGQEIHSYVQKSITEKRLPGFLSTTVANESKKIMSPKGCNMSGQAAEESPTTKGDSTIPTHHLRISPYTSGFSEDVPVSPVIQAYCEWDSRIQRGHDNSSNYGLSNRAEASGPEQWVSTTESEGEPLYSPLTPFFTTDMGCAPSKKGEKVMIGDNGWLERTGRTPENKKTNHKRSLFETLKDIAKDMTTPSYKFGVGRKGSPPNHSITTSLSPREQSLLYCELEFYLSCAMHGYITIQFNNGRLDAAKFKKVTDAWCQKGRPKVSGFRFDLETQIELIRLHSREFQFSGRQQVNQADLTGLLHSMKTNARAMGIRTYCQPDSVIAKQLIDAQSLFNLLGVPEIQHVALQQVAQFFKVIVEREIHNPDRQRSSVICELTFPSAVLAVRLNRKRLAVVLEDEIYLYDISNMSLLYTIPTSPNPTAICALSPSSQNCYLAYPLPKPREDTGDKRPSHAPPLSTYIPPTSGEVLVFDTLTLKAVNVIEAHKSPLCCVSLNSEGTLLATASEMGTIIRVFSVPRGQKLYQFRRGTYPSTIYSMSFNPTSSLLCVSSVSDTVHIFRLGNTAASKSTQASSISTVSGSPEPPSSPRYDRWSRSRSHDSSADSPAGSTTGSPASDATEPVLASATNAEGLSGDRTRRQSGSFSNMLRRSSQIMGRSVAGVVGSYLPQTVTEMWEPQRDFAYIKIPKSSASSSIQSRPASTVQPTPTGPLRSVVAMRSNSPEVMVITSDGGFYVFEIDMKNGGEGRLTMRFSVLDGDDKLDALPYAS
ncbi:hypothetical protein jhhlp_004291 [Lomentospora prolificans]|uniref:Autophagy-related protein 18 n=1 Tax=Lomentospora prolificans TaxID=41688 RepID=A0A2N3NB81_9PEZI|nr:hypothetical protein jhhlp_004291 [Lomentospora prolificans]